MPTIQYKNKRIAIDNEGFLLNINDFCDEWVEYSSKKLRINTLSENQLKAIYAIKDFYVKYNRMPLIKYIADKVEISSSEVLKLFRLGLNSGAKIAGLPSSVVKKKWTAYKQY